MTQRGSLVGRSGRADHLDRRHRDRRCRISRRQFSFSEAGQTTRIAPSGAAICMAAIAWRVLPRPMSSPSIGASLRDEEGDPVGLVRVQQTRRQAADAIEMRDGNDAHVLGLSFVCDVAARGR